MKNQTKYKTEIEALTNPRIGDYWNEMMVPYFIIVDINGDDITILNFLNNEPNSARINNSDNTWDIDFSNTLIVSKEWIESKVKYSTFDGFCADVMRMPNPNIDGILRDYYIHKANNTQTSMNVIDVCILKDIEFSEYKNKINLQLDKILLEVNELKCLLDHQ